KLVAEARRLVLVRHGEAVDRPPPARSHPLGRGGQAGRADRARRMAPRAAGAAALEVQLVTLQRLPVAARLLVDAREGLLVRSLPHARPRIMVTPLCRWPSMPPVPCTSATSASGTCAAPRSPRSCRVASMTRKMPRIPGWFDDSPPPSVLIGSAPPSPIRPSAQKAPPSPALQKPSASSVARTVMVYES